MKISFLRYRFIVNFVLVTAIFLQCFGIAEQGIITLQDGTYNYMCQTSVNEVPIIDYLSAHYNGGKILQNVYSAGFDASAAGIDFKNIIYEGSGQLWQRALQNPAQTVDWIIVKPDNSLDVVAQHVQVNDPLFLAQFTLVVRQSNNLRLYHRINGLPLANRPVPPTLHFEHRPCIT